MLSSIAKAASLWIRPAGENRNGTCAAVSAPSPGCSRMPGCMIFGIFTPQPLLLAGVPVHVVAARLGHADPSVTLRGYAHVIREQVAEAADIFARSKSPAGSRLLEVLLLANLLATRPRPWREGI